MPLPMFAFTGCQIMGSVTGCPAEMKEMMDLVTGGKVTPVPIIKRKLDEADATLRELRKGLDQRGAPSWCRVSAMAQRRAARPRSSRRGRSSRSGPFFLRAELSRFRDVDAEQSFRPEYLRLKRPAGRSCRASRAVPTGWASSC